MLRTGRSSKIKIHPKINFVTTNVSNSNVILETSCNAPFVIVDVHKRFNHSIDISEGKAREVRRKTTDWIVIVRYRVKEMRFRCLQSPLYRLYYQGPLNSTVEM